MFFIYNQAFFNRQPTLPVAMIVCVCHRVSDREIARHARAGMGFDDIQFELGVATQCGQCEGCAREVFAQCCASHPVASLHNGHQHPRRSACRSHHGKQSMELISTLGGSLILVVGSAWWIFRK